MLDRSLKMQPPPQAPQQLQQVADRLVVLNRIDHTISSTERHWRALVR